MSATISPERFIKAFKTDIDGCLQFAVENNGTTLLEISFDKGNIWIPIKPEQAREINNASGELYEGEMEGRFGEVYTYPGETAQPARNEAVVMKTMFKCANSKR